MTEEIKKKRMSKGCMVALIVVGVLFLMVVIAGVTCYMKKDALVKYGIKTAVVQIGGLASDNPQPGVDTTMFNAVITAFSEKIDADETPNLEQFGVTIQKIQHIPQDEIIDSSEAIDFVNFLAEIYPDLAGMYVPQVEEMTPESDVVEDSTSTE